MRVYYRTGPRSGVSMGAGSAGFLYLLGGMLLMAFWALVIALGVVLAASLLLCASVHRLVTRRWPGWLLDWTAHYRDLRTAGATVREAVLRA